MDNKIIPNSVTLRGLKPAGFVDFVDSKMYRETAK